MTKDKKYLIECLKDEIETTQIELIAIEGNLSVAEDKLWMLKELLNRLKDI